MITSSQHAPKPHSIPIWREPVQIPCSTHVPTTPVPLPCPIPNAITQIQKVQMRHVVRLAERRYLGEMHIGKAGNGV